MGILSDIKKYLWNAQSRQEQFEDIYAKNIWGGEKNTLFSGPGSYRQDLVDAYVEVVNNFLNEKQIQSVIEIGCGDFNVAKNYAENFASYVGIDIASNVISQNKTKYETNTVRFVCMDAVEESLPDAQLCLVRQVFQHLSNKEIKLVLSKLEKFDYVIIAETQYKKEKALAYNLEIDASRTTRRSKKSGVYLEEPPFSVYGRIVRTLPYDNDVDFVIYEIIRNTVSKG